MKKKILSVVCAGALALSMSSVAFADTVAASEVKTFDFKKVYKTTSGNTPATYPAETLKFTVAADDSNPGTEMITIADQTVDGNPDVITMTIPAYSSVGKYNYTVTEVAGNTEGVAYSTTSFGVQVLAAYNDDRSAIVTTVAFTTKNGESKLDTITNIYDLGNLTVTKQISGNLANKDQEFAIDVTFTSTGYVKSAITADDVDTLESASDYTVAVGDWSYTTADNGTVTGTATKTIHVNATESVTFSNIPAGVTYAVTEQTSHLVTDGEAGANPATGYTVGYSYGDESKLIAADNSDQVTVTNTKGTTVDTAISMESMPFVVMLVAAGAGLAVFALRRRQED